MTDPLEQQWREATSWWLAEGSMDPVYRDTIIPLLHEVMPLEPGGPVLDLGCGDGSVAAALGRGDIIGVDITHELLEVANGVMPVVQARLPHLDWLKPSSLAGAYCVLVLEHLASTEAFFTSVAESVAPGGFLVVVANHPAYTAAGSGPLIDTNDGEVLWRWGPYFSESVSEEPAGTGVITFHHRTMGALLTSAAAAGWVLEHLAELPLSPNAIARDPGFAGQEHLPRLVAVRWRRSDVS